MMSSEATERHEHKGPQCPPSGHALCKNETCVHDHHVSRHVEISCSPVKGSDDLYDCVHAATSLK